MLHFFLLKDDFLRIMQNENTIMHIEKEVAENIPHIIYFSLFHISQKVKFIYSHGYSVAAGIRLSDRLYKNSDPDNVPKTPMAYP